jgi:RTX calcium-binding nonapeptide repeat (4 copies)
MLARGRATAGRPQRSTIVGLAALGCLFALLVHSPAAPAGTFADVSFSDGTLRIVGDVGGPANDKHKLRCKDGFVLVGLSQAPPDPVHCSEVREVIALPGAGNDAVEMTGVTREFGSGGPIKITINGGPGTDRLTGAPAQHNFINGGPDSDNVEGGDLSDRLTGGAGNDLVSGQGGGDVLLGGPGKDALFGGPGHDKVNGGPGRDLEEP